MIKKKQQRLQKDKQMKSGHLFNLYSSKAKKHFPIDDIAKLDIKMMNKLIKKGKIPKTSILNDVSLIIAKKKKIINDEHFLLQDIEEENLGDKEKSLSNYESKWTKIIDKILEGGGEDRSNKKRENNAKIVSPKHNKSIFQPKLDIGYYSQINIECTLNQHIKCHCQGEIYMSAYNEMIQQNYSNTYCLYRKVKRDLEMDAHFIDGCHKIDSLNYDPDFLTVESIDVEKVNKELASNRQDFKVYGEKESDSRMNFSFGLFFKGK